MQATRSCARRPHTYGQALYSRSLIRVRAYGEVSEVMPPPPSVERGPVHTLLWFQKKKVTELGASHHISPGVRIRRESLPHSSLNGGSRAMDAVPSVSIMLPMRSTTTRGRSPTARARRSFHSARASEKVRPTN